MTLPGTERPVGVFDSGVGGLTVLQALAQQLPQEQFVYLGDTARLPYGTKSPETVVRYALQAADVLVRRGVKALIVACNTASAVSLPALRERYAQLPIIGVVEPGAQAAVAASRTGRIVVIGTEATVQGGAYQRAISAQRADARVVAVACQMFVSLAEEGWTSGPIAQATAQRYLAEAFSDDDDADSGRADTLVLGCTHFPMLLPVIRETVGERVAIVNSAAATARAAQSLLRECALLTGSGLSAPPVRFLATDGVARFAAIGSRFLGRTIHSAEVELVDL